MTFLFRVPVLQILPPFGFGGRLVLVLVRNRVHLEPYDPRTPAEPVQSMYGSGRPGLTTSSYNQMAAKSSAGRAKMWAFMPKALRARASTPSLPSERAAGMLPNSLVEASCV